MTERLGPRRGNPAGFFIFAQGEFLIMSQAMQLIVDGYVKLSGRKALQDMKEHRELLAIELRSLNSVLDPQLHGRTSRAGNSDYRRRPCEAE
jgi:hypothetical protein